MLSEVQSVLSAIQTVSVDRALSGFCGHILKSVGMVFLSWWQDTVTFWFVALIEM